MPKESIQRAVAATRWFCLILSSAPLLGAVIAPAPARFVLDGSVGEWKGTPPVSATVRPGGVPRSSIWLAQSAKGLVVAGFIREPNLKFAQTVEELATRGRLELQISLIDSIEMPPLTYHETACTSRSRGDAVNKTLCLLWVKEQTDFREKIEKLFTRVWRIAPNVAEEGYALPIFDTLTEAQRKAIGFWRPSELPEYKFQTGPDAAINFEILVPWHLFPPADRLRLDQARIQLRIADGDSVLATSDPAGIPADDGGPPLFTFSPPITTRITPCEQPLLGRTQGEENVPAYYFMNDSLEIDMTFFFDNPAKPYMPDLPEPGYLSPEATFLQFFHQTLDSGVQLCGPYLSYRKGNLTKPFPVRSDAGGQPEFEAPGPFPLKRLANGTYLIRIGPQDYTGPLWRKAWSIYSLRIFALTPSLEVRNALDLEACLGGCSEVDDYKIELSDDWQRVKAFTQKQGEWSLETFCLTGDTYQRCGNDAEMPPGSRKKL